MTKAERDQIVTRLERIAAELVSSFAPEDYVPASIEDAHNAVQRLASEIDGREFPR